MLFASTTFAATAENSIETEKQQIVLTEPAQNIEANYSSDQETKTVVVVVIVTDDTIVVVVVVTK